MRSEGASSDWRDSATIIDSTFPTALFVLKSTEIRDRLAGSIRSIGVSPEFACTLLTASMVRHTNAVNDVAFAPAGSVDAATERRC